MSVRIKTEDGDIVVSGKGKDGKDGTSGIPVPQTAEVGQVLAVKAVDDEGKPTEWECIADKGYVKPLSGIPNSDLATSVQTSLNKADTAVQPVSLGTQCTFTLSGTTLTITTL